MTTPHSPHPALDALTATLAQENEHMLGSLCLAEIADGYAESAVAHLDLVLAAVDEATLPPSATT